MPKVIVVNTLLLACFFSSYALADEACLLETNSTFMGIKLDIKDCIQNAGMEKNTFKDQCEGMSQAAVSMGGPAAKITYLSACPEPFQAKCDNSNSAKTVFFYYKRSPDEAEGLKSSCELMKGKYAKGSLQ